MKDSLLIIGAGGHGKVAADIAMKLNRWKRIAFLDDDACLQTCLGLPVLGKSADAFSDLEENDFFVAVGGNAARERLQEGLEAAGASVAALIHPNAVIGAGVRIGAGTAVMAGAVVNCAAVIGKGCILNTNCSLDHDAVIGDYVHVSPGAALAGGVRVGRGSWLGIGSVVSNRITVCGGCILGAGCVVVRDLTEPGTYVGIPAGKVR